MLGKNNYGVRGKELNVFVAKSDVGKSMIGKTVTKVYGDNYYDLKAKHPNARCIRQLPSGVFEGIIFGD